ncbi:hypothetical protein IMSAGC014_00402 [Bacteroidaceae bacterium]|nr:hypothetical protein IMSAGC014_00402 [Bacteroidaceae bacterium]
MCLFLFGIIEYGFLFVECNELLFRNNIFSFPFEQINGLRCCRH